MATMIELGMNIIIQHPGSHFIGHTEKSGVLGLELGVRIGTRVGWGTWDK